jgi:hypothetical protein
MKWSIAWSVALSSNRQMSCRRQLTQQNLPLTIDIKASHQ